MDGLAPDGDGNNILEVYMRESINDSENLRRDQGALTVLNIDRIKLCSSTSRSSQTANPGWASKLAHRPAEDTIIVAEHGSVLRRLNLPLADRASILRKNDDIVSHSKHGDISGGTYVLRPVGSPHLILPGFHHEHAGQML